MKKTSLCLLLLFVTLFSCVKIIELTHEDKKFVFTFSDIDNFKLHNYKIRPLKNSGKEYFFSKTKNHFGLYAMYGITLINQKSKKELKLLTSVEKFYNKKDILRLYNSKSVTPFYKDDLQKIDLVRFGAEKGYFIKSKNYFQIDLLKDNILYSIVFEGDIPNALKLSNVEKKLIEKMRYISQKDMAY
jgi:hypothetical protein